MNPCPHCLEDYEIEAALQEDVKECNSCGQEVRNSPLEYVEVTLEEETPENITGVGRIHEVEIFYSNGKSTTCKKLTYTKEFFGEDQKAINDQVIRYVASELRVNPDLITVL